MGLNLGKIAKGVLATVAPLATAALPGPLGGIANSLIKGALGTDDDAEVERLLAEGSPETMVKLKEIDKDLRIRLKELDIKEEEIHAGDRDSARDLAKTRGVIVQATLSAIFVIGYFGVLGVLLFTNIFNEMDDFQKGQIGILIGVLTGALAQILNFWFGTTKQSKEKDDSQMLLQERNGRN